MEKKASYAVVKFLLLRVNNKGVLKLKDFNLMKKCGKCVCFWPPVTTGLL